jgi:hypothetical protein
VSNGAEGLTMRAVAECLTAWEAGADGVKVFPASGLDSLTRLGDTDHGSIKSPHHLLGTRSQRYRAGTLLWTNQNSRR